MNQWKPKEIIIHNAVKDDPNTCFILDQCNSIPVTYINSGRPESIVKASKILQGAQDKMLDTIIAGKQVMFIAPAGLAGDQFTMPDARMVCPHFDRLKLASNGCFYKCDWCYLKLTYRAAFPFISVRVEFDKIKKQLERRLKKADSPVMFNSGELADSLSMEHITGAAREFISWFGETKNGYLFLLTKSDNVDDILDLPHNQHTIVTWSMNNAQVSQKFEIGAPSFKQRLEAARKVQKAGYPLRIRIDPVVPFKGWQEAYAETVSTIFDAVSPERITIGTLRFEDQFYKMRNTFLATGDELKKYMDGMIPMFLPKLFEGSKRPKEGKYSFSEAERIKIFGFIINEIRKYSDCLIAFCKESAAVWNKLNLNLSKCSCVCQLDYADMA